MFFRSAEIIEAIDLLMEYNVNVNARTAFGVSFLQLAISLGPKEVVAKIKACGAVD